MSRDADNPEAAEIVIVRRGGRGGEDGHHGGVWKIAYADFMTAMMAFFLVMWLVNAANEKTKQQVASYFNPIKLIDTRTNNRGLQSMDSGSSEPGKRGDPSGARRDPDGDKGSQSSPPDTPAEHSAAPSDQLQAQPETPVLKDILLIQGLTGQQGVDPSQPSAAQGTPPEVAASAGHEGAQNTRRDETATAPNPESGVADTAMDSEGEMAGNPLGELLAKAEQIAGVAPGKPVEPQHATPSDNAPEKFERQTAAEPVAGDAALPKEQKAEQPAEAVAERQASEQRLELLESVKRKIRESGYTPLVEGLSLDVEETREGVLISVAESSSTAMFDIATAKPSPELVKLAGQIANVLKSAQGRITVRGHTDGREYFTQEQDNWSLSSDRAHAAYRLLLDAGVPPTRFERIEGYADTQLKVKTDPLAASNRRVEVLLRAEQDKQ